MSTLPRVARVRVWPVRHQGGTGSQEVGAREFISSWEKHPRPLLHFRERNEPEREMSRKEKHKEGVLLEEKVGLVKAQWALH